MTKSVALLNDVGALLVRHANQNGINLNDEFKSVDDFKRFVIAFTFKTMTDMGIPVDQATDAVLGDGACEKIFNSVWEKSQSKK